MRRVSAPSSFSDFHTTRLGTGLGDFAHHRRDPFGVDFLKRKILLQFEVALRHALEAGIGIVADGRGLHSDLKKGERVRLIGKSKEGIHDVLEVAPGRFRTAFIADTDAVFVYGREVKDFRLVDYDAIAMLNVSATQELHRRLEQQAAALAAQTAAMKAQAAMASAQAARIDAFEKQAAEFALLKQQMAELQATVSAARRLEATRLAAAK